MQQGRVEKMQGNVPLSLYHVEDAGSCSQKAPAVVCPVHS